MGTLENFDRLRQANGKVTVGSVRLQLQKTMQKHGGVFRTQEILAAGCKGVTNVFHEFCNIKVASGGIILQIKYLLSILKGIRPYADMEYGSNGSIRTTKFTNRCHAVYSFDGAKKGVKGSTR